MRFDRRNRPLDAEGKRRRSYFVCRVKGCATEIRRDGRNSRLRIEEHLAGHRAETT